MAVGVRFDKDFRKNYKRIKNPKERDKADDALESFGNQGSAAAHFKYLTNIDKRLKDKGLVLARLRPLVAANAHGAFRILLREESKDENYTALDIQPHENCYRDWKRNYKTYL